jgi:hypothetical protein
MKIMSKKEQKQTCLDLPNVNNLREAKATRKSRILVMGTALLGMVAFSACNVNDEIEDNNQPQAVSFSAGIAGQAVQNGGPTTKAAGTVWASGDAIGIFMMSNGTTTIAEQAENKQYTTTGGSTFSAVAGDEIYYPMDGSKVDFIAYYPYASGKTLGSSISVDVSGAQTASSQADIDLLWAKANGTGGSGYDKVTHATTPVALAFNHKLAKMVINVKAGAAVNTPLTGMTVTIKGMNTKNTFKLSDGTLGTPNTPAAITPRVITTASGFNASYDAIILPYVYSSNGDVTVDFTVGGETFTWEVDATTFAPGNEYTYAVTLTRTGVAVTGTINPWMPNDRGGVTAE